MPCKQNKDVIEAAARGTELPVAVRGHVAFCAECHTTFAQETALFEAIDSHLSQAANVEPSGAFLASFQTKIASTAVRHRLQIPMWAFASATIAGVLVLLVIGGNWRDRWGQPSTRQAVQAIVSRESSGVGATRRPVLPPPGGNQPVMRSRIQLRSQTRHGRRREPDVLVSAGEEALLLRFYESAWGSPENAAAALPEPSDAALKPRSITPLEIAKLRIEELEKSDDLSN
jgi:hypothetical protein